MKVLFATLTAALAAPAAALAGGPTMAVRDVPLHGSGRVLVAAAPRFNLVGVHWRGTGTVYFRTRALRSGWSAWQAADGDTGPDAGSPENRLRGWHLSNLVWTHASDAIRFRTVGHVTQVRAYYVWSPTERTLARRLAIANAPPIIPRLSWGADESIRRVPPQYVSAIHFAVVHHTAGSNDYTEAQSAAIVRGIELYHVEGNGWNDIGYNFLIDKYGQVFEGRYGGVDKAVVGAHAMGFNAGSFGVSVLGDYTSAGISAAAKASLEKLLAWKLDLAHIDPLSTLTWLSGGNPRFPTKVPVVLRAIAGHRDTGYTDCPGNAFYAELPQIAKDVAALGGPKIYAPQAAGKLGTPIRFSGHLSGPLPWTVTVADANGVTTAQGSGTGSVVDWTWDATVVPLEKYTWTIATPGARSATGTIGSGSAGLALTNVTLAPSQLSPGGDPADDTTTISYTLTAPATVTATLVDANGQSFATLSTEAKLAGAQTLTYTATPGTANGTYTIQLVATTPTGTSATASVPLTIDDTLDAFVSQPAVFSAAKGASVALTFTLTRGPVTAQLQVLQGTTVIATPTVMQLAAGPQTLSWNGLLADGTTAPDGTYTLALMITDATTTFTRTSTVTLDSTPPVITVLSYKTMRFRLSEPVTLTLVVGANRYTRTLTTAATTSFWLKQKPRAYRLIATDAAGNSTSVSYRSR